MVVHRAGAVVPAPAALRRIVVVALTLAAGCGTVEPVLVEGIAQNAKSGAQILTADKCVDLRGFRGWPDDVVGKRVRVKGRLTSREVKPPTVLWELRDDAILKD